LVEKITQYTQEYLPLFRQVLNQPGASRPSWGTSSGRRAAKRRKVGGRDGGGGGSEDDALHALCGVATTAERRAHAPPDNTPPLDISGGGGGARGGGRGGGDLPLSGLPSVAPLLPGFTRQPSLFGITKMMRQDSFGSSVAASSSAFKLVQETSNTHFLSLSVVRIHALHTRTPSTLTLFNDRARVL